MKSKGLFIIFIILAFFFTADSLQNEMLSEENEKAIRNLHDVYEKSLIALDLKALSGFYADEAVQMPPNEPVAVGKSAILARIENFKGISFKERERPIKIIGGRDDLIFVWSSFRQKGEFKGSPFSSSGGMLQVYRKQSGGSWKIVFDVWSYDN